MPCSRVHFSRTLVRGPGLEASPQGAVQEAGGPSFLHPGPDASLSSGSACCPEARLGGVDDAVAEASDGVNVPQAPAGPPRPVHVEVLQAQSGQVLQRLLGAREVAAYQNLMSLRDQTDTFMEFISSRRTSDQLLHNLRHQNKLQFKPRLVCRVVNCGVRVDGDLAGASSVAIDGGAHLLSHQQGGDLLLRGDELTSLGLLQGFPDEAGVTLDLRAGITLSHPEWDHSYYTVTR
ncbi:hypothetical protein EYF80_040911 [Liparis tanakae]|uniref:Uncharacterized protein n=1 Tax=Liparis tanakae TaxID=230148 RepID=A0A4Z2G5P6_9TELE|nr:hypothetical protein EYF80_040911 [Liparis tanakae]